MRGRVWEEGGKETTTPFITRNINLNVNFQRNNTVKRFLSISCLCLRCTVYTNLRKYDPGAIFNKLNILLNVYILNDKNK